MNHSFRAAALLTVGLAAACGDAPTEPATRIVAEHARAELKVPVALPSLEEAELMEPAEFARVLADLAVWADAADARLRAEAVDDSTVALGRAALAEAARLEEAGDRNAAVAALVDARARLVRATAGALAGRHIAAAIEAEARCKTAGPGAVRDEVSVRRGSRLLAHALEAQADGDFERAIQRAHYAEGLLAGECPARPESGE